MADIYYDTDTGLDSDTGATWALAKLTAEGNLAIGLAGDRIFKKGAAVDTTAALRTLTSAGVPNNKIQLIGCKTATTNEGNSIVPADLLVRGADTLAVIQTTVSHIQLAGSLICSGINFNSADRIQLTLADASSQFDDCEFNGTDFRLFAVTQRVELNNCAFNLRLWPSTSSSASIFIMTGGVAAVAQTSLVRVDVYSQKIVFDSVDMSGSTFTHIADGGVNTNGKVLLLNCRLPISYVDMIATIPANHEVWEVEMIGCSTNSTAKSSTGSYQEHEVINNNGRFKNEAVAVRTGGATDNASGLFSYKLTPAANLQGVAGMGISTPWMDVWVKAGSKTANVYFANDGGVNYTQSEITVKILYPAVNGLADYDLITSPSRGTLTLGTATIVPTDSSTWAAPASNPQVYAIALAPGYEGKIQVQLTVTKSQATPNNVYVDPLVNVV